jgi:RNA 2',3'-cyclic 3'-phosphodiesterase
MTRTFLALELPDAVKSTLRRQIERLGRAIPEIHWVNPESLHLTLAFLGEIDDAQLMAASESAAATARAHASFTLRLDGLGTFGSAQAPRVVWVGLAGDKTRLMQVHATVADELAARGFTREQRPFAPHLTLARIKKPLSDAALAVLTRLQSEPPSQMTWRVDAISVMKSELLRPAARYTALSRSPLRLP